MAPVPGLLPAAVSVTAVTAADAGVLVQERFMLVIILYVKKQAKTSKS